MAFDIIAYQEDILQTKSPFVFTEDKLFDTGVEKTNATPTDDIIHAIVGVSTESGELLDAFKKQMFYGKAFDLVNLDEEFGDLLWYIALYAEARGITIPDLAKKNSEKLHTRYRDKFSQAEALDRDLAAERKILER